MSKVNLGQSNNIYTIGKKKINTSQINGGVTFNDDLSEKQQRIYLALDGKLQQNGKNIGAADKILDKEEITAILSYLKENAGNDRKLNKRECAKLIQEYGLQEFGITEDDIEEFFENLLQQGEGIEESAVTQDANGQRVIVTKRNGITETRKPDGSYTITTTSNNVQTTQFFTADNKLAKEVITNPTSTTTTFYEEGKKKSEIVTTGNNEESYIYNSQGKRLPTQIITNKGHDVLQKTVTYQYGIASDDAVDFDESSVTIQTRENGKLTTITRIDNEDVERRTETDQYTETAVRNGNKWNIKREYPNSDNYDEMDTDLDGNLTRKSSIIFDEQTGKGLKYDAQYKMGSTYVSIRAGQTIEDVAREFNTTPAELAALNIDNEYFNGGKVGDRILVPGELDPSDKRLSSRGTPEEELAKAQQTTRRNAANVRFNQAVNHENSLTTMDVYLPRKAVDPNGNGIKTWRDAALYLYSQEGITEVTETQLNARIAVLKKLNPELKQGDLVGHTIKAKVNTSSSDQKNRLRTQTRINATSDGSNQDFFARRIATKGFIDFDDIARYLYKREYTDSYEPTQIEINQRVAELKELNPQLANIKPDRNNRGLYGKVINCTMLPTSYKHGEYDRDLQAKRMSRVSQALDDASSANNLDNAREAISYIKNADDFNAFKLRCRGDKLSPLSWETKIPEEIREKTVSDWYRNGIISEDELLEYQARKATRELIRVSEGINIANGQAIHNALKLIVDPTGTNPSNAAKVKALCDGYIKQYTQNNIQKFNSVEEYIGDEASYADGHWYQGFSTSDRDNTNFLFASNGVTDATPEQKVDLAVQAFISATKGAGTNEYSIKDIVTMLSPEEFQQFTAKLKAQGINIEETLYDELSSAEVGEHVDKLVAQGSVTGTQASTLVANNVKALLDDAENSAANPGEISKILSRITTKEEFDKLNNQLPGGIKAYIQNKCSQAGIGSYLPLAEVSQFMSEQDQIEIVYNLLNSAANSPTLNNGQAYLAAAQKSMSTMNAQTVAKIDAQLQQRNLSISAITTKFANTSTTASQNTYITAPVNPNITPEQTTADEEAIKVIQRQFDDFVAQYESVKNDEGALSRFSDEILNTFGFSASREEIDKLIQYNRESIELYHRAAQGTLATYDNGKVKYVSLQEIIKARGQQIRALDAANSVDRTHNTANITTDNATITRLQNDQAFLELEDDIKSNLLGSWAILNSVSERSSREELASTIQTSFQRLSFFCPKDKKMALPEKYAYGQDGRIKYRANGQDVPEAELMQIIGLLKAGTRELTKNVVGVNIPPNATNEQFNNTLNNKFAEKKASFDAAYEAITGTANASKLIEKHQTGVGYMNMGVQAVELIGAAAAAGFTGGGTLAVFTATASTSYATSTLEGVTSANGLDPSTNDANFSQAIWDGIMTAAGMKLGTAAEAFAKGETAIAQGAIAKQTAALQKLGLSGTKLEKGANALARAEGIVGIDIGGNIAATEAMNMFRNGELDEQELFYTVILTAGGTSLGHAVSIVKDKVGKLPANDGNVVANIKPTDPTKPPRTKGDIPIVEGLPIKPTHIESGTYPGLDDIDDVEVVIANNHGTGEPYRTIDIDDEVVIVNTHNTENTHNIIDLDDVDVVIANSTPTTTPSEAINIANASYIENGIITDINTHQPITHFDANGEEYITVVDIAGNTHNYKVHNNYAYDQNNVRIVSYNKFQGLESIIKESGNRSNSNIIEELLNTPNLTQYEKDALLGTYEHLCKNGLKEQIDNDPEFLLHLCPKFYSSEFSSITKLSKEDLEVIFYARNQYKKGLITAEQQERVFARTDWGDPPEVFEYIDTPEDKIPNEISIKYSYGEGQPIKKSEIIESNNRNKILRELIDKQSIPAEIHVQRGEVGLEVFRSVQIGDQTLLEMINNGGDINEILSILNNPSNPVDIRYSNFIGTSIGGNQIGTSIRWDITCPKGTKGGYLDGMMSLDNSAGEMEFILQAGTKLRINSAEYRDGMFYLKAEAIQDGINPNSNIKPQEVITPTTQPSITYNVSEIQPINYNEKIRTISSLEDIENLRTTIKNDPSLSPKRRQELNDIINMTETRIQAFHID